MAAISSTAPGNWSAGGTWVGGVAPGNGDTATVLHAVIVDVNTTVGNFPVASTVVLIIDKTGANAGDLSIADGVRLSVKGDVQTKNANITWGVGSGLRFDFSDAVSVIYRIVLGSTTGQTNKLISNGTVGSPAILDVTGTGIGYIGRISAGATAFGEMIGIWNITNWGNQANPVMDISVPSGGNFTITNTTFDTCGKVFVTGVDAAGNFSIQKCEWKNHAHATILVDFQTGVAAATTGTRTIKNNIVRVEAYHGNTVTPQFQTLCGIKNWVVQDNMFTRWTMAGTDFSAPTAWKNNLHFTRGGSSNNLQFTGGTINQDYYNNFHFIDEGNAAFFSNAISVGYALLNTTGTVTYEQNIFQTNQQSEEGDFFDNGGAQAAGGGAITFLIKYNLALPNSRLKFSGSINSHDNKFCQRQIEHNTIITNDDSANSGSGVSAIYTGASFLGKPGYLDSVRSNLVWSPTTLVTTFQSGMIARQVSIPITGACTAGCTTTVLNIGTLLDHYGNTFTPLVQAFNKLADCQAVIIFTSGALIGTEMTISDNSAGVLTMTSALGGTPANGDTFKIVVRDIMNSAQAGWNGLFNVNNGTIYDQNGANGVTKRGYENYLQTTSTNIGQSDVNLGSGAYTGSNGPKFKDWTRNFELSHTSLFGQSTGTAWSGSSVSYNAGDIVSYTVAGVYGGLVLNYRCVSAHTSSTVNRPGDGSGTWRTQWEPAIAEYMRVNIKAATTYTGFGVTNGSAVEYLNAWVKDGFVPQNALLKGAAHDGTDIGAVAMASSSSGGATGTAGTPHGGAVSYVDMTEYMKYEHQRELEREQHMHEVFNIIKRK